MLRQTQVTRREGEIKVRERRKVKSKVLREGLKSWGEREREKESKCGSKDLGSQRQSER